MALGSPALLHLSQNGVVPKGRTITSLRNKVYQLPGGAALLLSYSVGIEDVDYSKYIDLVTDVRSAIRWCLTGSILPKVGRYRYVNDFSDLIDYIKSQYKKTQKPVRVAMDTETLGLDPYAEDAYIVSVQLTAKPGESDLVKFSSKGESKAFAHGKTRDQMIWLLTSEEVSLVGANFKYDQNWLVEQWGLPYSTNFKFDTTLVGSLLDENRSNSLNTHAKIATDIGGYDDAFNATWDKSRMDLALAGDPEGFKIYAGGDTDACLQVAVKFRSEILQDDALSRFYVNILHPASRAYEQVERVGWHIDRDYYEFLRDELEYEISELEVKAREILGGRIVAKHLDKKTGLLNITKASLLKDFMFSPMGLNLTPKMKTEKTGEPSTSMDHLMMFEKDPKAKEFVGIIKQYASATKTHSTYVVGFLKHLRRDGRFHPSYFLYAGMDEWADSEGGTVTGRLSVKDPAIQTIPKHTAWAKRLRKCFIAPPGFLILSNDYSQGELKIAACLANERNMLSAYLKGIDLHAVTGAALAGYTLEDFLRLKTLDPARYDSIRQLAKAGNFGLLYGMGAEGFQSYAYFNYGLNLTFAEASDHRDTFLYKLYPRLPEWHEESRKFARMHKYIRSPLGRIRHLPMIHSPEKQIASKAGRQAINSPVQSTLSDMSLWSAAIMWKLGMLKIAPLFGMVHDQNLRYVPEDNWEFHKSESVEVMENLPFDKVGWKPQLRFTVDSEIGPTLGDLKKVA